jgi:hypothetical protein
LRRARDPSIHSLRLFARLGDLHRGIDEAVFSLETLLEWADRDEREGIAPPPDP